MFANILLEYCVPVYLLAYNVSTKEAEWRRMEWNGCHEHSVGTNLERDVTKPTEYNHESYYQI